MQFKLKWHTDVSFLFIIFSVCDYILGAMHSCRTQCSWYFPSCFLVDEVWIPINCKYTEVMKMCLFCIVNMHRNTRWSGIECMLNHCCIYQTFVDVNMLYSFTFRHMLNQNLYLCPSFWALQKPFSLLPLNGAVAPSDFYIPLRQYLFWKSLSIPFSWFTSEKRRKKKMSSGVFC